MAEFKLGRIKFVWKDDWVSATVYYVDDVIRYGGRTYICKIGHTAAADFYTDLDNVPTKWNQMSDGQDWQDDWTTSTFYKENDIVRYGGRAYIANQSHTSAATAADGLELDQSYWDIFTEGFDWKDDWSVATRYKVNDLVRYGGKTYVCNQHHTSAATIADGLEVDQSYWDEFNEGIEYKGDWTTAVRYKTNDVVKYGAGLWICVNPHTSDATFVANEADWSQFVEGLEFESDWNNSTPYQPGDIVKYGGNLYISRTNHVGATPSTSVSNWTLFNEGFNWVADWGIAVNYRIGDVVRVSGSAYLATVDSPSATITVTATNAATNYFTGDTTNLVEGNAIRFSGSVFGTVAESATYFVRSVVSPTTFTISTTPSGTTFIPSTASGTMTAISAAHPTNVNFYQRLVSGISWRDQWQDDREYEVGDAVRYENNAYICVQKHRAEGDDGSSIKEQGGGAANSRPDQDTAGLYWNVLTVGSEISVLTTRGDLVYYGGAGPARLPIGVNGQVLQAGPEDPQWISLGQVDFVYFVSTVGIDEPAPVHGTTLDKTWKTVRYACEQIEKGPRNPNTKYLLERNRVFIQKEVTAWIRDQITNNTAPFTSSFDYDEYKCERDVGFIIDRLIWDISHGGNLKIRAAAQSFVGALGEGPFSVEEEDAPYATLAAEADEGIAAYQYMLTLVEKVLNNEAPAVIYQNFTDDSVSIADQYFNTDLVTEPGTMATITGLVNIVIQAIEDGDSTNIPARQAPHNLVKVTTGVFEETLPIIVPAQTAVLGDELRSTKVVARGSSIDPTDAYFSIPALNYLSSIIGDIVTGSVVTPTTGNTESQITTFPTADVAEAETVRQLIQVMRQQADFRTGSMASVFSTDATGYNSSFLNGYGDARKLVKENKKFFQEELIALIAVNYPLIRYSRTKCKKDVGYIVDAVAYDLTYGGNSQTINAGLAYFDGPGGGLMIDSSEKAATLAAYQYLKTIMQSAALNNTVSSLQNTIPQFRDTAGSAAAATNIGNLLDIIYDIVEGGTTAAPRVTVTSITGTDTLVTGSAHNLAIGDSFTPRSTANGLVKGYKYWVVNVPSGTQFKVSTEFGGSALTVTNGTGLSIVGDVIDHPTATDGVTSTTALITAAQTLDAAQELIVKNVIDDLNSVAWHTDFIIENSGLTNDDFVVYVGKHSLAHTYVSGGTVTKSNGTELTVTNFVYNNATGFATITTSVDHNLEAGDIVDIENITVSCTSSEASPNTTNAVFPSGFGTRNGITKILYIQHKCIRDIRIILESVMFDFMFNSNFQSTKAAYSYLRSSAAEVFTLGQKSITRDALTNAKTEAVSNVGGDTTAQARITSLMTVLDDIIYSGSSEGNVCQTDIRNRDYAVLKLEENRDFITAEISAYIADTFSDTATDTTVTTNVITISDTSWLVRNAAVKFTGTTFGGIVAGTTYYVQNIVSATTFTIAATRYATSPLALSTASGSMGVEFFYNSALCSRDVGLYVEALKWDLKYTSNHESIKVAQYYTSGMLGSQEENMYLLRDATGIRDQTVDGLRGDLTAENAFGTSRVTAGAYCSLDPGWGPDDFRTWIISRSPYVQGVTTFGFAAIGQKIDGALHNGGNDSITSNDFTQVISDGIGAWVENNGRAELVSVFSYYAHIGYLATNGGRIRGTNGNCSYGDFGAIAEGVDLSETPNTAVVDNRFQFNATVAEVNTNGNQLLNFEFDNAGIDYSELTWTVTGGGLNANVIQEEFRDDAVYQVRLIDLGDDSSGQFGGEGYLTSANTAQGGTSTSLTLAATDGEPSTAYIGMKLYLNAGAGVGQYGIISTYNAGTKIAGIVKESDGTPGWDHVVPGTTIVTPDASTTYIAEPRLQFSSPGFSSEIISLPSSGTWNDVVYGDTSAAYTTLSGTYDGAGIGATFQVRRNGFKYIPVLQTAGTGYTRLETITIAGTSMGGLSPENDLVITITAVSPSTGAVIEFDFDGYGSGGRFVAVGNTGSTAGAYSSDGVTWSAMTLPSTGDWSAVAYGLYDDGSTIVKLPKFVAIRTGSDAAAYSEDGINWTASVMPASTTWTSVAFGEELFVAISSSSTTVAISADGEIWDVTGTLNATGFVDLAYGRGRFVAVKTGSVNAVEYSEDGITWTQANMPANVAWNNVAWGNNRFVAVATDSNSGAYSLDGITWTAMTMGSVDGSSVSGYQKVAYGQGVFMATAYLASSQDYSFVATSEDGIVWTARGVDAAQNSMSGYNAVAFGNPQRIGTWVALQYDAGTAGTKIRTGATTRARAAVAEGKIFLIRIVEPGSGYDTAPTMTITDPNNVFEAPFVVRTGSGVVANPTFFNRGTQFVTGSAELDTGDGYADNFQPGGFVAVRRITQRPIPGSNIVFSNLPGRFFKLVNVITFLGENDGGYTAFFQVSPILSISEAPAHLDDVTTRIRYSQVRLTGHDFLDIGTGNFTETNYPGTPLTDPIPTNETVGSNGGRVFFTTTDQDGNFRVGDLFAIEQSTGVATLNADAFNISGLQELNLGNVTLGGGSATITEFSTDPFFTADSDNIVPTQRAIKAFIAGQIGGGGASLNVNSVTAGSIFISSNEITTTTGGAINMQATFEFRGGVIGVPLAFNYFLTS